MGNHRRTHHHHITSFNPSCCFRPSPTEGTPNRSAPTDTTSSSSSRSKQKRLFRIGSMSFTLSSPRISWMGQINRSRPSSHDSSSSSSSSSATTSSTRSGSLSSRGRSNIIRITKVLLGRSASPPVCPGEGADDHSASGVSISVVDMDPPLPVLRRAARSEESNSLWERRCSGAALRGLQIQSPQQQLCAVVF